MTDGKLKPIAHESRAFSAERSIRKSKKRLLGLYSQSQNSTTIFMVDLSLYKQPILTIFGSKKIFLRIQLTDCSSIYDEVLLYMERIVIPSILQKRILKDFHAGHQGSTRMKSLMRSYVHWPNMDKDIENAVKSCKGCALAAKAPPIKFNPWPKMFLPWSRIHIDFGLGNTSVGRVGRYTDLTARVLSPLAVGQSHLI